MVIHTTTLEFIMLSSGATLALETIHHESGTPS